METRNRKFHSWTAKHKGKRRSKKPHYRNAPKYHCKPFWGKHRAEEFNEIARFLKGVDEGFLRFPYHHKQSATWDYA